MRNYTHKKTHPRKTAINTATIKTTHYIMPDK